MLIAEAPKIAPHVSAMKNNIAAVVTGETGSGKTTQIPQFLLEQYPTSKVLVMQPRRLAAVGVAMRVADEMNCTIGEEVGYMIKGDTKCSNKTQLAFCTYGVLLRLMKEDDILSTVDYVILDEVHERGMESDFALGLLVKALQNPVSQER